MTIWNLGGINADFVYAVPHIASPGETLNASDRQVFLGGKGANMSVAAARAGAHVRHIGAVGPDGRWAVDRMLEYGVDVRTISQVETQTAHAMIFVAPDGENSIAVYQGASINIPETALNEALTQAETGDWFITQNETNLHVEGVKLAKKMGLLVGYAAAPFDLKATEAVMPFLDFLILNEVEAEQLARATGTAPSDLPVQDIVVTRGSKGAVWFGATGEVQIDPVPVTPVDTTGAGDTFTGYVIAGLDRGHPMEQALKTATKAAALMVTRRGTADVIPDLSEVQKFSGV